MSFQPQRCRRDDIDRVNICTCLGCEMYRDQNYKLRAARITKRDAERRAYGTARRVRAEFDLGT